MRYWFIEYFKRPNNYANKIVKANTAKEAIKKSRLKNIEDIKEINENNFTDVKSLITRYEKTKS
ncbi:MAG: hypothetical protein LUH05_04925 [Candidatus Gastranaerophilales bacterium]|nr:hypothetical protein [Candidatus Gastranaerophilales bacterium]